MRLTLAERTAALLELVEKYREARRAEILDPAHEQARSLLRRARAEGRRRVHTAVGEARQRLAAELNAAQARLATERRLARQQQAARVLQQAWDALHQALVERWHDATARRLWCDGHLARALDALPRPASSAARTSEPAHGDTRRHALATTSGATPRATASTRTPAADSAKAKTGEGGRWRIEHAGDWPAEEREAFAQRLREAAVTEVAWQARKDIAGGLRIRAGSNVLDATIDGLLADRAALEGHLLDALQAAANGIADTEHGDATATEEAGR